MPLERSAGAVIYRRDNGQIKYLLLHYPSMTHRSNRDYWDFAKGHVEKGESEVKTIMRETEEETGISDLEFRDGFHETMKYFFRYEGKVIFKIVSFKLAQTKTETIRLSGEHDDFIWLPYKDACRMLSFENARKVISKANEFLDKRKAFMNNANKEIKALLLMSGGLDSILAAKVLEEQDIKVTLVCFESYFFSCDQAKKAAAQIGLPLRIEDIAAAHLEIVKNPRFGRGAGVNPCIDCHLLMLKPPRR